MIRRKAQGLSVSTIILIALGLIVLVAMVFIMTGKIQIFGENVNKDCAELGGKCVDVDKECDADRPVKAWASGCPCTPTNNPQCTETKQNKKIGMCCMPL